MNKAIIRMTHTLSRNAFEQRLGGTFEPVKEDSSRRVNGKWVTYKEYSKEVPQRMDCFCQALQAGAKPVSGRNWSEVAKRMGIATKNT